MNIDEALAKSRCGIAVKQDTYQTRTGEVVKATYFIDKNRRGQVCTAAKEYPFVDYMRGGVTWIPWEEWFNGKG